ncbi:MAG: MDR family MFS transporter [Anaerolineae bacterium]
MLDRIRSTYRLYPQPFWVLTGATFIDRVGGTVIFPFFSLYITQKFEVGMTEAGVMFGIWSIASLIGQMVGGALADQLGRRAILLFGLVFSALSSVSMGLVEDLGTFYILAAVVGLLSEMAGPAHQAMVADMLPEERRADGFGITRVAGNLAWIAGPTIGGLVAARSFFLLFVLDAISSLITAVIVYRLIPETKPEPVEGAERQSFASTLRGYRQVLGDRLFVAFVVASMIMTVVYLQLYSTLPVYLRDVHGVPARGYGLLMSANATAVVLFQFWTTRRTNRYPPMLMMALGTTLYLVGFTAYGLVSTYFLFLIAMMTVTFGEMIVIPVGQALASRFAPEDKRGRYMAFFGLTWMVPSIFGHAAAGLILDNYDPRWVWYLGGMLSAVAAAGFLLLHTRTQARFPAEVPGEPVPVV